METDEPTYVFAPYNFSRNWNAHTSAESLSVLKANYNFIGVPIEPGVIRVELEYLDTANVVFSVLLIGLGILVVVWFTLSKGKTIKGYLLAVSGVVLIGYSFLEIPGIANTDLPERPAPHVVLPSGG